MAKMRLDRFFSAQGRLSRSEVKAVVKTGGILINDRAAKNPDETVDTDRDKVFLHRQEIFFKPYIYIMMNKPKGVVSVTEDKHQKTVLDLIPPELYRKGLFPAGRLDKDSTGFVLITNDGDFAHNILSPKHHVEKTYLVTLDGRLTAEGIKVVEQGVTLHSGEACKPARVTLLNDSAESLVEIVLIEGKYHQIKRMFGTLKLGVNELSRIKIGALPLDTNLELGECREILHKEIDIILGK